MNDESKSADLPPQHDILRGHTVSEQEALLRASGGALKGASPVAAHDRTMFAVRELLETVLVDGEGSLRRTILTELGDRRSLVARHFGEPRTLLRAYLEPILAHEESLAELVRATDARWGRDYAERPHFDRAGRPSDPEDPYTLAGVRRQLEGCLRALDASR